MPEFDEDDIDPETMASIERAMQDLNDGFGYEMLNDGDGFTFKCLKCARVADINERPFPHRYDCPMRDRIKD